MGIGKIKINVNAIKRRIQKRISLMRGVAPSNNCNDFFANCCNCCDGGCPINCPTICILHSDGQTTKTLTFNGESCCYEQFQTGQGDPSSGGFQVYHNICYVDGSWQACATAIGLSCNNSNNHTCVNVGTSCFSIDDTISFDPPPCLSESGVDTSSGDIWTVISCVYCNGCPDIPLPQTITADDGAGHIVTLTWNGGAWCGPTPLFAGITDTDVCLVCTVGDIWYATVDSVPFGTTGTCEPFERTGTYNEHQITFTG